MTKEQGISVILPHLNEDLSNLKRIIKVLKDFLRKIPYEIIIMDGGSNMKSLRQIKKLACEKNKIYLFIDYPLILPNKNVGIYNASNILKYEDVFILDCDYKNLSNKELNLLKKHLKKSEMVVPNLNRVGGRSNRILGNPFMRLFFPEVYKKIPYPFPGIIGIKKALLKRITNKENYCFDWGGESNIIIEGYHLSKGKVSAPEIIKHDKKRALSSMVGDAFQIYRNNILLSVLKKRFPRNEKELLKKIRRDFSTNKKDLELLKEFVEENKIEELKSIKEDSLEKFDEPSQLVEFLDELHKKYGLYEFYLIKMLALYPLMNILWDKKIKLNFLEKKSGAVKILDLRRISFFVDLVIAKTISLYIKENKRPPYNNLKSMLKKNNNTYKTEFINNIKEEPIKQIMKEGINTNCLNQEDLNKIKKISSIKNPLIRNKKIENYYLGNNIIGKVGEKNISINEIKIQKEGIKLNNDYFVKIGILTTIAGYLKTNKITINAESFKKDYLERFLSYVLNNKKFAPMNYNLSLQFTNYKHLHKNHVHDYDCVILFSGGFDSTAAFLKALDQGLKPLLLWVGFGQKNENAEYKKVKEISKKIKYPVSIIRVNLGKYIEEGWKEWDYIIPARNFMFISMAAAFLSSSKKKKLKIYLSAHEEEIKKENTDKSEEFFRGCNYLFSKFYNKMFNIGTPFREYSKSEIAFYWKKEWIKKYGISPYQTTTCYYGNNCGLCKACLKRSISLLVGGFELDPDLKENPFRDKKGFISEDFLIRFEKFPLKRRMDLIIALGRQEKNIPKNLRKKYLYYKEHYKNKLSEYQKSLSNLKI